MYWNNIAERTIKPVLRLIETWDVLKWRGSAGNDQRGTGLIETWDVLK